MHRGVNGFTDKSHAALCQLLLLEGETCKSTPQIHISIGNRKKKKGDVSSMRVCRL
jgi:hypothetical protein